MPLGGRLPGIYPDPLDPQSVQDMSNAISGSESQIPTQQEIMSRPDTAEQEAYSAPPQAPEIDGSEGNMDRVEMSSVATGENPVVFPGMYGPAMNPNGLLDEGSNYLPVGGPYGKETVNDAFNKQPKALADAVMAGGEAQAQEAKVKEGFLAEERDRTRGYESALKEQYMLRQQEMQAKQQHLEKTAQSYTDNLANQGAFWHNPQNVIAAMGAALMQLTTDDRSFGYKLLNGAIQSDLHNRRALADGHLGQLRSNMAEYDKIAGDRISGMQLAEVEAKRVAAIELERIAAQFQGPKAKAQAAAITAKLWQDVRIGYMDFYHKNIYNKPRIENKAIIGSLERGGQAEPGVGYTRFADPKNPRAGQPGFPDRSTSGSSMGTGGAGHAQGMGQALGGTGGAQAPSGFPQLTPQQKSAIDARYQGGSQMVENAQRDTTRIAYRSAGVQPGTPPQLMSPSQKHAFNKSMEDQEKAAYEALSKVSTPLAQSSMRRAGLRSIQTDMAIMEAAVKTFRDRGLNITMDDLLSTKTKTVIGAPATAKWQNIYSAWAAASPESRSKWEDERAKVQDAGERLNQLISGTINSHYKEQGGAAITDVELPRLEMYASAAMKYSKMKNFIDDQSRQSKSQEDEFLVNLPPAAQAMWLTKKGVGSKRLESSNVRKYQPAEAPEGGRTESKRLPPNKGK